MACIEANPGDFIKGKWIWFRISNDSVDKLESFFKDLTSSNKFNYIYAQFEQSSEEDLHLQGMCHSNEQITSNQFKQILHQVIPVFGGLKSTKAIQDMDRHVHREETKRNDLKPLQHGTFPDLAAGASQQRSKKEEVTKVLLKMLEDGVSINNVRLYGRKHNCSIRVIEDTIALHNYDRKLALNHEMTEAARTIIWKDWQKYIFDYLKAPVNPREILVVVDKCGNSGKTFFMKNYKLLYEDFTINLTHGDTADLLHIISKKPKVENILINLPRTSRGIINYQVIEQAKDGVFCSTKYNSQEITIPPQRMVIFTNKALNWDSMSHDRFKIMVLNGDDFKFYNYGEYMTVGGKTAITIN